MNRVLRKLILKRRIKSQTRKRKRLNKIKKLHRFKAGGQDLMMWSINGSQKPSES
jgi:hypothetical protein